jgi:type I restriction enzyme S subunit
VSELPKGWTWTTLGDVSEKPQYGWTTKADPSGEGVRLLRTTDITSGSIDWSQVPACTEAPSDLAKYLLTSDDIVVSRAGSVGASIRIVSPPPAVFASYLIRLRAVGVEPAYISWFLRGPSYWSQIRGAAAGIALANVNAKKLAAISMPLSPLNEQKRIVAVIEEQLSRLDAADRSLAQAKRRLNTLRAATLAAATRGHEPVELGTLVTELRYGTSIKCSYDAKGPPVLRIPNVQGGNVDLSDLKFATDAELDLSSLALGRGDLLFVRTNGSRDLIGRVASIEGAEGMAFASYLIRARPDASRLDSRFAVIALSTPASRSLIEAKAATTAGQYNLNLAALRALPVPLPPIEEQRAIVAEVERQLSVIDAMDAQIDRATRQIRTLRRAILARAFRGELAPQNPDDEPAGVLLARIASQRAAAPKRARRPQEKAPA